MKKIGLLFGLLFATMTFAQSDIITKHNGETVKGKVVKVDEFTIIFKYDGEDAENTISKYAVQKIVYGKSGRVEDISDKIIVNGEDDWEKVVIVEDKAYIAGLKKVDEVRGKTGLINYHTGNTGDKKAEKKLKMAAAEMGCPFILQTADNGFMVLGYYKQNASDLYRPRVTKFDQKGDVQWEKRFDDLPLIDFSGVDEGALFKTPDNGYMIVNTYPSTTSNGRYGVIRKFNNNQN